jgi:hypothetical protein
MESDKQKSELVVLDTPIAKDEGGRFSLNDLHRAAVASGVADTSHRPGQFMRNKQTAGLIAEIEKDNAQIRAFKSQRGRDGGTFACEDLVYAYAMWISAAFHLKVIRAVRTLIAHTSGEQLSAADKALRAEKRLNEEVFSVSQAASKLARSKRTVPPLRSDFESAVHGLQTCFPGFDVTPMIEAAAPKPKRTRKAKS